MTSDLKLVTQRTPWDQSFRVRLLVTLGTFQHKRNLSVHDLEAYIKTISGVAAVSLTSDVQLDPAGGGLPEGVPGRARVAAPLARPHPAHAQRGTVEDSVVKVVSVHRGTLKWRENDSLTSLNCSLNLPLK